LLVGAGALILIVLVAGVGGFVGYKWLTGSSENGTVVRNNEQTSTNGPAEETGGPTTDLGKYWLELLPVTGDENVRVAGTVPLASGQPFKFHFQLAEDGYLYIIGPGQGNQLTAFLTAKPPAITGVTSNKVTKSSDFSFPTGITRWLELDQKPGTENYTVIFSTTPLSTPAFLNEEATGEPMPEAQQSEFKDFLSKHQATAPQIEIEEKNTAEPFMLIKVPRSGGTGNPIVFPIRIQHN
jgi:hypothetical protein